MVDRILDRGAPAPRFFYDPPRMGARWVRSVDRYHTLHCPLLCLCTARAVGGQGRAKASVRSVGFDIYASTGMAISTRLSGYGWISARARKPCAPSAKDLAEIADGGPTTRCVAVVPEGGPSDRCQEKQNELSGDGKNTPDGVQPHFVDSVAPGTNKHQ
jgi:hypothetical protein